MRFTLLPDLPVSPAISVRLVFGIILEKEELESKDTRGVVAGYL